ncbi:MAG: hypothetical protein N4A61_15280 [Pelagimonas sp.]|jgi:hypothetical protein|nr:hypothetical protein [Pelagimonas sp.]
MTNRLAIILGAIIIAALVFDAIVFGWSNALFLARKFYWMLEYLAFWR